MLTGMVWLFKNYKTFFILYLPLKNHMQSIYSCLTHGTPRITFLNTYIFIYLHNVLSLHTFNNAVT